MESSINERINSQIYSDVINSYADINAIAKARNIEPNSLKHTVQQCTDMVLSALNNTGGQGLYTRLLLSPVERNATLAQTAQIFFQYVIPANSLAIIAQKTPAKDVNNGAVENLKATHPNEHLRFKLFYDSGASIANMLQLSLVADVKVNTQNFNYQQALLTLNSLPDKVTDKSTTETTLKALVEDENYRI